MIFFLFGLKDDYLMLSIYFVHSSLTTQILPFYSKYTNLFLFQSHHPIDRHPESKERHSVYPSPD